VYIKCKTPPWRCVWPKAFYNCEQDHYLRNLTYPSPSSAVWLLLNGQDGVRQSLIPLVQVLRGTLMVLILSKVLNAACSGSYRLELVSFHLLSLKKSMFIGWHLQETDTTLFRYPLRVLIFNCTGSRSGANFLAVIKESIISLGRDSAFFDHVIFCANVTYADGNFKGGAWQSTFNLLSLI
jgi:hypothetical protein